MKTECKCHELPGDYCLAERPRYFPRQIITADDLTLEQEYFRNKLRRHNRLLHGWGVVCGALVCPVWKCHDQGLEPWKVTVQPGYILGPFGDEILIESARSIDLRRPNAEEKSKDPCGEQIDPWCNEPCPEENIPRSWYLAVKYKEIRTRPVRVQPLGCGCDDQPCEYSRFCDGYEFGWLRSCPSSHQETVWNPAMSGMDLKGRVDDFLKQCHPDCPPCPEEPWVVLAEIELDQNGQVLRIDNCTCRRLVISTAAFWRRCTCGFRIEQDQTKLPGGLKLGRNDDVPFQFAAGVAKNPLKAYAGPGITAKAEERDGKLVVSFVVTDTAQIGTRTLIVTDANCSMASVPFQVEKLVTPKPPVEITAIP